MKTVFYLVGALSLFALTGCGLELDNNNTQAQDILQTKTLIREYSAITGIYEGVIKNSETKKSHRARFTFFIVATQQGADPYGRPRMFPLLKANYTILFDNKNTPVNTGSLTLTALYIEENGSVTLSDPVADPRSGYAPGTQPIFSLTGKLVGKRLTGQVYNHTGYIGQFDGHMVLKDNSFDSTDNDL